MHTYEVNLKCKDNRSGFLISSVFPQNSEKETPPELPKTMKDIWSPEHLLLSSLNSCLMTTFLSKAENANIQFVSFESSSSCAIEVIKGKNIISEITLRPKVVIPYFQNPEQVKYILEMSKNSCLISNIIKTNIRLEPEVSIELTLISKEEKYDFG